MNLVLPSPREPASFSGTVCALGGRILACALLSAGIAQADDAPIVAVSARASDDYVRAKLADGSYKVETYTFGEGGAWRSPMSDASIDRLGFIQVARTIAPALTGQNYRPSTDLQRTDLLIMVYWGMTAAAGSADSIAGPNFMATLSGLQGDAAQLFIAVENSRRDRANFSNAGILGYDEEWAATRGLELTAMRFRRERLAAELEDNRYFVVLMAYDLPLLLKEKKHKLVWQTRFSIRERGQEFDRQLASMAQSAARYFGRNSDGLRRISLPDGQVKLDELKILGVEPAK